MTRRPAETAAVCKACCANKNMVIWKIAMINAKNGGAMKANSTAVVPPRERQKRATAPARRRKCLDKFRNMLVPFYGRVGP